jgi:hypothetical protein
MENVVKNGIIADWNDLFRVGENLNARDGFTPVDLLHTIR